VPSRGRTGGFEPGQAGWLFADMLLVLSIVMLGAATVADDVPLAGLRAQPAGAVLPTAPATASPSPSALPVEGIERTPTLLRFTVDTRLLTARDGREVRRVRRLLAARTAPLHGRRAALVLTFGCDRDSRIGSIMSTVVNGQLRAADAALFGDTVTRSFMDDSCRRTIRMEIYLFAR